MKFVLVMIIASLNPHGEIEQLSLIESEGMSKAACAQLEGPRDILNEGVATKQVWAVCKPLVMGGA